MTTKFNNGKLHNFLCSQNIIVIKSGIMRWTRYVACTGNIRNAHRIVVRKSEGRDHWGDIDVDGMMLIKTDYD